MFFFEDPFDYDPLDDFFTYNYVPRRQAQRRIQYENAIQERLNQVLREEFGIDPYHRVNIQQRANQLAQQQKADSQDHSEIKKKVVDENRNEEAEPDQQIQHNYHQPVQHYQRVPYSSFYYSSASHFDGKNFVEEHREKVTDADGKVTQTTRRRLGDRWYEAKSITDKDGKTSSKETWHNVPEDKIEQFKAEWAENHEKKYAIDHDTAASQEKPEETKQ